MSTTSDAGAPRGPWVGPLGEHADFVAASELYQRVFGYTSNAFSLNANLLTALVHNGGSAVGARAEDGSLVGFAYGFMGTDGEDTYHYSQAAVVDPAWQGHGLGRLLKLAQADVVRGYGVTHMRWAYNPVYARNGHFNLNSLGAIAISFVPDYYGRADTDRLLVDWSLDGGYDIYGDMRRLQPPARTAGAPIGTALDSEDVREGSWVVLPSTHVAGQRSEESRRAGAQIRDALAAAFEDGKVFVSCVRTDNGRAAYLSVPRVDAQARARRVRAA